MSPVPVSHPFSGTSARTKWTWFVAALLVFVGSAVAMNALVDWSNHPPDVELNPYAGWIAGIWGDFADFEMAGSDGTAQIVDDWGDDRWRLSVALLADYPFLLAYAVLLSLPLAGLSDLRQSAIWARRSLAVAAWLPFAAAGLDAVENAALLSVVAQRGPWLAHLATWAAMFKFTLIHLSLVAIVAGALVTLVQRTSASRPRPQISSA